MLQSPTSSPATCKKARCRALCLAATALTLLPMAPARAAAADSAPIADSGQLEEITVTAQKRKENLQNTPIAITAFTARGIEQRNMSNISELGNFTPSLIFRTTSPVSGVSSGTSVFIRGIGQSDFALTTEAGVGTYVDGVYMSRSVGGVLDVLDIERIEVLRGPQGTLFGRNTIGGAISITSEPPGPDFGGKAEITVGSANRLDTRISINAPVSDKIRTRFVASSKNRDGYVHGLLDGRNLGNEDRQSARATVQFLPADNLTITLSADGTRIREQNAADILVGVTQSAPGANGPGSSPTLSFLYNNFDAQNGLLYDNRWITGNYNSTYATGPNGTHLNVWGTSAVIDWTAGEVQIKSTSAYRKTEGFFNRDPDGSPLAVTATENSGYEQDQFSQELQINGKAFGDRLKWVAGGFYFTEKGHDPLTVVLPASFGTIQQYKADVKNSSYAGYGQATLNLTNAFAATAGLRYTRDKKNFVSDQVLVTGPVGAAVFGVNPGDSLPLVPLNSDLTQIFTNWSPYASLDYHFSEALMTYVSYSKGFKSGGFNLRYTSPQPAVVPFAPEKATTYEAGAKWEGLDHRIRLNAAAYYTNYTDIQVTIYDPTGAPATRNSGAAHIKGFELEMNTVPVDNLQIGGGLSYNDNHYTKVNQPVAGVDPRATVRLDNKLPNTPKWQLNGSAEYTLLLPGANAGSLVFRSDVSFTTTIENDAQNSPFLKQGPAALVNGSITYITPSGKWELVGFVTNITDKRIITSGDSNYGIGFHEANVNRPREWGATLRANF